VHFLNWIWHIRGSIPLAPGQSSHDVFHKLDHLFKQPGTTYVRIDDTLSFEKRDQLAQDRMSIFDGGLLQIEQSLDGLVLRYHLVSRALLFCFLAPLLFVGIAQLTVALGHLEKPKAEVAEKNKGKKAEIQLNPVDKFLGAPAPEKPEEKNSKDNTRDEDEDENGFSPTPAYVFSGIFAVLYGLGRILEAWLIKGLFERTLA
jgi:hypothetical protein